MVPVLNQRRDLSENAEQEVGALRCFHSLVRQREGAIFGPVETLAQIVGRECLVGMMIKGTGRDKFTVHLDDRPRIEAAVTVSACWPHPGARSFHQNPLAQEAVERGPEMRPDRAAPCHRVEGTAGLCPARRDCDRPAPQHGSRDHPVSFLIDTKVISELRKGDRCNPGVAAWWAGVGKADLFLSPLILGKIRKRVELARARDPQKAAALDLWRR